MDFDRYGLTTIVEGAQWRVVFKQYDQTILVSGEGDALRLTDLINQERDRVLREIAADVSHGYLPEDAALSLDALGDVCDANVYFAGGRSDGQYGDEKHGWSDLKTAAHTKLLLSGGLIGLGTGKTIDPEDLSSSEAFTGFQNAVMSAVERSLELGIKTSRVVP